MHTHKVEIKFQVTKVINFYRINFWKEILLCAGQGKFVCGSKLFKHGKVIIFPEFNFAMALKMAKNAIFLSSSFV